MTGRPRRTAAPSRGRRAAVTAVPPLGPPPRVKRLRSVTRTLSSGLWVIAVRQPGVPLVEARLRIPLAGSPRTARSHAARVSLLADTMLTGTAERTQTDIAQLLQRIGADLSVSADADRLVLSGSTLAPGLATLLGLVAEVLTAGSFPAREVGVERDRLIERLQIARTQPAALAREALAQRMYGDHPYAHELPLPEQVASLGPAALRRLLTSGVAPDDAVLVLVGDIAPARALDAAEAAFAGWATTAGRRGVPPLTGLVTDPMQITDRPGSVQSAIRLGGRALRRDEEGYPAYQLANLVFGGYFSSRLTENIREDKGFTYSPSSRIDHAPAGSALLIQADVTTEVTAQALVEIRYELDRMATGTITDDELAAVRQYAIGTLALSIATQSGLATMLTALAGSGLGVEWIAEHTARLAAVGKPAVIEAAHTTLAAASMVTVVLGDALAIADEVARLGAVEVRSGRPGPT